MENKISCKEPKNLNKEIEKLFSFEEKDELFQAPQKAKDRNTGLNSKYAKVLSCSFVNPDLRLDQSQATTTGQRIQSRKERFFQAI